MKTFMVTPGFGKRWGQYQLEIDDEKGGFG
jgi:hypothetical protein